VYYGDKLRHGAITVNFKDVFGTEGWHCLFTVENSELEQIKSMRILHFLAG